MGVQCTCTYVICECSYSGWSFISIMVLFVLKMYEKGPSDIGHTL